MRVSGDISGKGQVQHHQHTEHEEEAGSLTLHPHEMTQELTLDDISSVPFREQWFHGGLQTFEELEKI